MAQTLQNVTRNNESQRYDWQRNHLAVQECITKFIQDEQRMPSMIEMECATGLSRQALSRHAKSLNLDELREKSRLAAVNVLESQATRAIRTGDHNEAKTYFKLNFDWVERQEMKMSVNLQLSGKNLTELQPNEKAEVINGMGTKYLLAEDGVTIIPVEQWAADAEFEDESPEQAGAEEQQL